MRGSANRWFVVAGVDGSAGSNEALGWMVAEARLRTATAVCRREAFPLREGRIHAGNLAR